MLELLRGQSRTLDVSELAEKLGLHPNSVRAHLEALIDTGYVQRSRRPGAGRGRPRWVYRATAAPEGGRNYRLLAELLVRYVAATSERPAETSLVVGRSFAQLETALLDRAGVADGEPAVGRVVQMLADLGFAPELAAGGMSIRLRHCPFRELALTQPEMVCGVHLGILQGALAELGAPVQATRLLPFAEADLCIASLAPRPTAGAAAEGVGAGAG